MILQSYPLELSSRSIKREHIQQGVIFDSCVLFVYFLDKYVNLHPDKKHLLKRLNVTENQINCLNTLISNLRISKIIITPYILSEFFNRIRNTFPGEYQEIKKECIGEIGNFSEIHIDKNILMSHDSFLDFGNDISLLLATEEQISKFEYCSIMSFDGRFIREIFAKTNGKTLAFDLKTLENFF